MKKLSLNLFLLFVGTLPLLALSLPEKSVPLLENFTPDQYQNRGKVWSIAAAPNGIIYMASDGGLLEYDGRNWASFSGSNGFTRSIMVVNDSLMYTGSDLDFGVWRRNLALGFDYTSLYPFQEDLQDVNEEFWRIYHLNDNILFVSSRNIYIYKNEQLVKIAAPSVFKGSFQVDGDLYFADQNQGMFRFEDLSLKKIFGFPESFRSEIAGLYHDKNDSLIIVTRDLGLYMLAGERLSPLNNALSQRLASAKVFSFEMIGESYIAFGTVLSGLFITDWEGIILHHINRHKGLFSNTILSMHYSHGGKLWLGLDYGVSALNLKSNITTFFDYRGDFGTGYTALLKDGIFYLGTNQGLYSSPWESLNNSVEFFRFGLIPGTEGQVWSLASIDGNLLMGHDRGLFKVTGNTVERLNSQAGVWTIIQYKDYLLTGNYNGISIYYKAGNKWDFVRNMDLIYGSCNQLIIENDNVLWVNIPTFGIIRAVLDGDLHPAERIIFPKTLFPEIIPSCKRMNRGYTL